MSHTAICPDCEHPRTLRKPWLVRSECADCVQDFAVKHRRETGHNVELRITTEPTIDNLRRDTRTANLIARKHGW